MTEHTTPPPRSWREGRRQRAWALHQAGWKQSQIAEALGVTQGAVSGWLKRAKADGVDSLRDHPPPGAASRLSDDQLAELPLLLGKGPTHYGWLGEVWTAPRVARLIKDQFAVSYHPAHMSRLLRRIGWSLQKPVTRAAQRDPNARKTWFAERWPQIKKKQPSKGGASSG